MDSHTPFLAAIRAAPADDAPRLVYADWLSENGEEERAEFVRRQVRGEDSDRRIDFEAIEHIRMGGWRGEIKGLRRWSGGDAPEWVKADKLLNWADEYWLRRGFVDSLTCAAADWLAHGDAILERHPVRRVRLTTVPQVLRADQTDWNLRAEVCLRNGGKKVWMEAEEWPLDNYTGPASVIGRLLAAEWPGVAFELPPEPRITPTRPGDVQLRVENPQFYQRDDGTWVSELDLVYDGQTTDRLTVTPTSTTIAPVR